MIKRQRDENRAAATHRDPISASAPIFAPLEQILTSGGDTRLHLDPATMVNGYGCRPFPRPEAYLKMLAGEVAQVRAILHKIQLILRHFNRLHDIFRE